MKIYKSHDGTWHSNARSAGKHCTSYVIPSTKTGVLDFLNQLHKNAENAGAAKGICVACFGQCEYAYIDPRGMGLCETCVRYAEKYVKKAGDSCPNCGLEQG